MYVLARDVEKDGRVIPKGTVLRSIYQDTATVGVLALATFAGEQHKLSLKQADITWESEPRCGS